MKLLALLLRVPKQFEGKIKMSLSRVVAAGVTFWRFQIVAAFVPYRPNRVYVRVAVGLV